MGLGVQQEREKGIVGSTEKGNTGLDSQEEEEGITRRKK